MHYVFKSKADADLIMMEPAGDQILRIVGREPARRGIIEAAAIPAAMRAIEAAVAAEAAQGNQDDDDDEARREPRVGLAQRAWPLLEMMKRALAEQADIVWGV
jgi:cyclopropane-fatty-acyl-phospholipid synthase